LSPRSLTVFDQGSQAAPPQRVEEAINELLEGMRRGGHINPGATMTGGWRVLAEDLPHRAKLFGAITEQGWVCTSLLVGGNSFAACDAYLQDGITVHLDSASPGGVTYVFGCKGDDIASIEVLDDHGAVAHASAGENGFIAIVPPRIKASALSIRNRLGEEVRVELV
jgi:hypothetical protein